MEVLAWSAAGLAVWGITVALAGGLAALVPRWGRGGARVAVFGGVMMAAGALWLVILMAVDLYGWTAVALGVLGAATSSYLLGRLGAHIHDRSNR